MKYQDAVEYLEILGQGQNRCSAERIQLLLERCENPQKRLRFLVVRGKKNHGALGCFLASVLQCADWKTGRGFQPVLQNLTEWITLNGKPISQTAFSRLTEQLKAACETLEQEKCGCPTREEILAVIGLLYFAEKKADYVLAECFGEMADGWQAVLEGCRVQNAGNEWQEQFVLECCPEEISSGTEKLFRIRENTRAAFLTGGGYEQLEIRLPGQARQQEAVMALNVVKYWTDKNIRLDKNAVQKGITEAEWPGHLQVLAGKPQLILQETAACTEISELSDFLKKRYPAKHCVVILGMTRDVNASELAAEFSSFAGHVLTVAVPGVNDSLTSYELAVVLYESYQQVTAVDSPEEALEIARLMAGKDGVIAVCGARRLLGRLAAIVNASEHKRHKDR